MRYRSHGLKARSAFRRVAWASFPIWPLAPVGHVTGTWPGPWPLWASWLTIALLLALFAAELLGWLPRHRPN